MGIDRVGQEGEQPIKFIGYNKEAICIEINSQIVHKPNQKDKNRDLFSIEIFLEKWADNFLW